MAVYDVSKLIPADIQKIDRDDLFATFLDTTPSGSNMTLNLLGIGITEYGISYNPQVDTEKWVVEKNSRNIHKSNQKQASASQTAYKNDPVYEFVKNGRDKLNYVTHIVDVDICEGTGGSYPAKLSDGLITITNYGGDDAKIEYDLAYNGDPIEGTVTFDNTTGKPVFTRNTSL